MSTFRFPESWNLDAAPERPTSEQISWEINPTILGKPAPRPDKWWAWMLEPWTPGQLPKQGPPGRAPMVRA